MNPLSEILKKSVQEPYLTGLEAELIATKKGKEYKIISRIENGRYSFHVKIFENGHWKYALDADDYHVKGDSEEHSQKIKEKYLKIVSKKDVQKAHMALYNILKPVPG